MQSMSGNNAGWAGKKKAAPKIVVDPRPGRKVPNPGLGTKPGKGAGVKVPNPGLGIDDKIYRTMPITEKQLGQIKKHYGIK